MNALPTAWKDNSGGGLLQFDFVPPPHWNELRLARELAAILSALERMPGAADQDEAPGWLALARGLPSGLLGALIAELRAGNVLTGIGSTGWPSDGSIVVNVREPFRAAKNLYTPEVTWRQVNDPHYWREQLAQTVGATAYLIIA